MLKNLIFQCTTRVFMPGLAKGMQREGTFRLYEGEDALSDESQYILVEDRQAEVTIFVFSGLDALFTGCPRFEFRKVLLESAVDCNLVFIRELRRMWYHVAPDGGPNGPSFYESKVRELMGRFNSGHYVAVGSSAGAGAAFYFATRCAMDQIVAFSPILSGEPYGSARFHLGVYLNLKSLVCHPKAHVENALVTISGGYVHHRLMQMLGEEGIWRPAEVYRNAGPGRPRATVYYGAECPPDQHHLRLIGDVPGVKRVPVHTGSHNSPAYLKKRGELGSAIMDEIRAAIAAKNPVA